MTPPASPDPAAARPASVWLSPPKHGRRAAGPEAGSLSREKTVATALRLLDADGEDGLSMRKLAVELGVTPMSVYWHVATKDDLLELALDAVAGEVELPDPDQGSWTDGLRALSHAWRATMLAHPWALPRYGRYLNIGPHSMRIAACGRAIIARAPLPAEERSPALAAVFEYVYGATAVEARWAWHARQMNLSVDDYLALLAQSMAAASGPAATDGVVERGGAAGQATREADFDRGVRWLLAGISGTEVPPDRGQAPGSSQATGSEFTP